MKPTPCGTDRKGPATEISSVRGASLQQLRAWHAVIAASMAEDLPGMPPPAFERFRACLDTMPTVAWQASRADGEVVGVAVLRLTSSAQAHVHVHPPYRGCGIGSELLNRLAGEARGRNLSSFMLTAPADGPGDRFCRRRGLLPVRTLHHLLLSLRDIHPGWLDELVTVEHPGYELTEAVATSEPLPGDVLLTVTAEHRRQVVGCTEVVIPGGSGPRAHQHDHPLAGGHRGLGLDLWIKAAMLRTLYDGYPQVTEIATDSVEDEEGLLAVNRHLGFRLHHRTHEFRHEV